MGFTAGLFIIYLLLALAVMLSFKRRKMAFVKFLIGIMVLGILVLGYLWFTSPM